MLNREIYLRSASEAQIQESIVAWMEYNGYAVMETGKYWQKPTGGNDLGLPDLVVRGKHWPRGCCLLLEVKTATGRLKTEQKTWFLFGGSYVVRNQEEAIHALRTMEKSVRTDTTLQPISRPAED
jgi:hypothetical protein